MNSSNCLAVLAKLFQPENANNKPVVHSQDVSRSCIPSFGENSQFFKLKFKHLQNSLVHTASAARAS